MPENFQVVIIPGILLACLTIQLVFGILLLRGMLRGKRTTPGGQSPGVSIIVAAHDELPHLKELIPLLLNQDYPEFEVIIVDDRSNDDTYDYLLQQTAAIPRLKCVHVNTTPKHVTAKKFALTLGIKAATYDWVLLTDADCRPVSTAWVREMMAVVQEDTRFVLGVSPYQKQPGLLNAFIRFEALVTACQYIGFAGLNFPYMGVGRNLAYPKSFFLESKGFNKHLHILGGDDDLFVNEFAQAKTTRVCLHPDARMFSFPKTTLASFWNQKVRHLAAGKRYKTKHIVVLGLLQLTWLGFWLTLPAVFFLPQGWQIGLGALGIRWIWQIFITLKSVHILGHLAEWWKIPLLDIIYPFYYLSTSLAAAFTKRVQWKK